MSKYFNPGTELDYCFGTKDRSNSNRKAMSTEERKRRQRIAQVKHRGKTITELGLGKKLKTFCQ